MNVYASDSLEILDRYISGAPLRVFDLAEDMVFSIIPHGKRYNTNHRSLFVVHTERKIKSKIKAETK